MSCPLSNKYSSNQTISAIAYSWEGRPHVCILLLKFSVTHFDSKVLTILNLCEGYTHVPYLCHRYMGKEWGGGRERREGKEKDLIWTKCKGGEDSFVSWIIAQTPLDRSELLPSGLLAKEEKGRGVIGGRWLVGGGDWWEGKCRKGWWSHFPQSIYH